MIDIGTRLGPYEIVSFIGAGGMGHVFQARDSRLDRDVAIKGLPDSFAGDRVPLSRFEREAKAIAALSHPNIVAIFDFGTSDGVTYAVTELLEGETLRAHLDRGRIAWRRACEVGASIADGLGAAHARGIVHRDLKPENLFLGRDGRVKILDFGLARSFAPLHFHEDQTETAHQETARGAIIGTIGYMSPEQVRGEAIEPASDLFSLGCVLYEMLAGERAFARGTKLKVRPAILDDRQKPLGATGVLIPAELEQLVLHCLAKPVFARFQSARDVALTLRSLLETAPAELTARSSVRFDSSGFAP